MKRSKPVRAQVNVSKDIELLRLHNLQLGDSSEFGPEQTRANMGNYVGMSRTRFMLWALCSNL